MKKPFSLLAVLLASLLLLGCVGEDKKEESSDAGDKEGITAAVLCGSCGHEKGTDACCADDAEVCEGCSLHKGSELCCKELGDAKGKDICKGCGDACEDGHKCATDGEECSKCGLHKGSAACCKLGEKESSEEEATE